MKLQLEHTHHWMKSGWGKRKRNQNRANECHRYWSCPQSRGAWNHKVFRLRAWITDHIFRRYGSCCRERRYGKSYCSVLILMCLYHRRKEFILMYVELSKYLWSDIKNVFFLLSSPMTRNTSADFNLYDYSNTIQYTSAKLSSLVNVIQRICDLTHTSLSFPLSPPTFLRNVLQPISITTCRSRLTGTSSNYSTILSLPRPTLIHLPMTHSISCITPSPINHSSPLYTPIHS